MGPRTKILVTLALAGACAGLALPSMAGAAPSGVTIHFRQPNKFVGFVFSPKPRKCAADRWVRLFRQKGKKQNRKRDVFIQAKHASKAPNGKYKWTVHRRPLRASKFYARMPAISGCQRDRTKTIHAP